MEQIISEKTKHINFLQEQLANSKELPPNILVLVLNRIKQDLKDIMKSISKVKVTLPQNYEKKAAMIVSAQKLLSSVDQNNQQTAELPPLEIERAGEKVRANEDNKRSKTVPKQPPKQPVHGTIFTLLEDEDEEIRQDSEDLQSKTKLPALLLANETSGPNTNMCFVNGPVQLLRHISAFRCAIFLSYETAKTIEGTYLGLI